ncbi:MAG: MFS transporter [Bdellovibrionales bacterium]
MKDKRIIIIFITVFMDLVGFGIVIPLNPYLAEHFGASPLEVGLLMSVYSFLQFLFAPVWGQLSDRLGRRPIILISLLGSALAHTAFAFSTSFTGLMLARGFAGLFGGNISTAMAYMADISDEKSRSKSMGLIGAAFGLGFLLGPALGGAVAGWGIMLGLSSPLSDSFPALVAGGICFLNFLAAIKILPETRKPGAAVRARPARFKMIFSTFQKPVLGPVLGLVFVSGFAMAHIEASLFLFVQDKFGWSLSKASFGFAYIGLILVFTQGYLIRKWLPKFGESRLLLLGFLLATVGYAIMGFAPSVAILAVAVTFLGLGVGLINPSLHGSVSLLSDSEVQGNNLGVSQSLASIARILGPPTGGALYQHLGIWSPFSIAAGLGIMGAAAVISMQKRLPNSGKA